MRKVLGVICSIIAFLVSMLLAEIVAINLARGSGIGDSMGLILLCLSYFYIPIISHVVYIYVSGEDTKNCCPSKTRVLSASITFLMSLIILIYSFQAGGIGWIVKLGASAGAFYGVILLFKLITTRNAFNKYKENLLQELLLEDIERQRVLKDKDDVEG